MSEIRKLHLGINTEAVLRETKRIFSSDKIVQELVQNALRACAQKISISLKQEDRLVIEHDGREFDDRDWDSAVVFATKGWDDTIQRQSGSGGMGLFGAIAHGTLIITSGNAQLSLSAENLTNPDKGLSLTRVEYRHGVKFEFIYGSKNIQGRVDSYVFQNFMDRIKMPGDALASVYSLLMCRNAKEQPVEYRVEGLKNSDDLKEKSGTIPDSFYVYEYRPVTVFTITRDPIRTKLSPVTRTADKNQWRFMVNDSEMEITQSRNQSGGVYLSRGSRGTVWLQVGGGIAELPSGYSSEEVPVDLFIRHVRGPAPVSMSLPDRQSVVADENSHALTKALMTTLQERGVVASPPEKHEDYDSIVVAVEDMPLDEEGFAGLIRAIASGNWLPYMRRGTDNDLVISKTDLHWRDVLNLRAAQADDDRPIVIKVAGIRGYATRDGRMGVGGHESAATGLNEYTMTYDDSHSGGVQVLRQEYEKEDYSVRGNVRRLSPGDEHPIQLEGLTCETKDCPTLRLREESAFRWLTFPDVQRNCDKDDELSYVEVKIVISEHVDEVSLLVPEEEEIKWADINSDLHDHDIELAATFVDRVLQDSFSTTPSPYRGEHVDMLASVDKWLSANRRQILLSAGLPPNLSTRILRLRGLTMDGDSHVTFATAEVEAGRNVIHVLPTGKASLAN